MARVPSGVPPIAIGMPVYNGERWLKETIPALLGQTFRDFVLVISDNASTDNTGQICEKFAAQDSRVRYYRNSQNIGIFRNYDKVFHISQSKYFKWHSANDLCDPTFLEICFNALDRDPGAVGVYPGTMVFTDDPKQGEIYPYDFDLSDSSPAGRFKRVLLEFRLNNAFNGLIRADALRRTSMNRIYLGSDVVLLAELALQGTIKRIPQNLFFRRISPSAAASFKDEAAREAFFSTAGRNVLRTPHIDFVIHCFAAALRAPMSLSDRMFCAMYAARWTWRRRGSILHELPRLKFAPTPVETWSYANPRVNKPTQ
jgi:glycosyltransferase involved in cell wall biosynthesis